MRVCVAGAGAIGGWVAARLAIAGNPVMALSSTGLVDRITLSEHSRADEVQFTKVDGPVDLLIIAVKAPALPGGANSWRPLIGEGTLVLPMLNGVPWWFTGQPLLCVDPDGAIAATLPLDQVIGCVVHASCCRPTAQEVEVVHADRLILGEPAGGTSERVERLCALFQAAGISCEPSTDVRRAIWYKLWGNATINPLSALTRSTADRLLADPVLRAMMAEAMDELARVGQAVGCPIEESADDRMAVTARLGAFKSSMLQDIEAGRAIEIEALVGAPIEIARREGIATPALDRIHAMTRLLAENLGLF